MKERLFKGLPTGRKDKNGKPIKEGDIISSYDGTSTDIVIYITHACGFGFQDSNEVSEEYTEGYGWSHSWGESQLSEPEKDWEVIGSIYNQ